MLEVAGNAVFDAVAASRMDFIALNCSCQLCVVAWVLGTVRYLDLAILAAAASCTRLLMRPAGRHSDVENAERRLK